MYSDVLQLTVMLQRMIRCRMVVDFKAQVFLAKRLHYITTQ